MLSASNTLNTDENEGQCIAAGVDLTGTSKIEEGTISTDTIEINGLKGGKIVTRNVLESGQVAYGLNIHLYFKNDIIQLRYVVGAPTENEATSYFHEQEAILMGPAKKTEFYN